MKKLKIVVVFLSLFAAWYFGYSAIEKNPINESMLVNIEALAHDESSGNYDCFGYGEIDCYGDKVEARYDYNSLD